MIRSIIVTNEDGSTIYTVNGPAIIHQQAAIISIAFSDGLNRVIHFDAPEDAAQAFTEISDWLASDTTQLVISL